MMMMICMCMVAGDDVGGGGDKKRKRKRDTTVQRGSLCCPFHCPIDRRGEVKVNLRNRSAPSKGSCGGG